MRLFPFVLTAIFLAIFSSIGHATPLEDTYIAARDRYIETFKKYEDAHQSNDRSYEEEKRALRDLETQLQRIIGPVSIKGFSGLGKINLQTLVQEGGFGMMDGLVFDNSPNSTTRHFQVFVTTPRLVDIWLRNNKEHLVEGWLGVHSDPQMNAALRNPPPEPKKAVLIEEWLRSHPDVPQSVESALRSELFHVELFESGAAAMKFAEVPVAKPKGADLAAAIALIHAQDVGALAPGELFVSVVMGPRVFVAHAPIAVKVAQIPMCNAIWNNRTGALADMDAENKAYSAFLRCYAVKAKDQSFFPALVKQAQTLADLLPQQ